MKKPLVSVMIPTYKRPLYCEQAVRSALEQDYPALEVIVCDNSPDEETAGVLARFSADRRFRYVRNREARTKAENFAPFERLAQGVYLQWLMDDDLLLPGKISRMADCLSRNQDVKLVTSNRSFIDGEGHVLPGRSSFKGVPEPYGVMEGALLGREALLHQVNSIGEPSAVLFRRQDLRHHYWRADCRGYLALSDMAMWLELLEKGDCAVFRQPLSAYRRHEGQEGQQPEVVLLAKLEWFQLGEESYSRGCFLDRGDYVQMLESLLAWHERELDLLTALAPASSLEVYMQGMDMAGERLRQLRQQPT